MEYRKLPKGDENISVLGLGTSSIGMTGEKEIEAAMTAALEAGINYFDMARLRSPPMERSLPEYGISSISKFTSVRTITLENTAGPPIWTPSNAPLTGSSPPWELTILILGFSTALTRNPTWTWF